MTTPQVCYWDPETKTQQTRDATEDEIVEIEARKAAPPPVPSQVTMRQARRALLANSMLSVVNGLIAGMEGSAGDQARIDWDYSQVVERAWPLVETLRPALGLTTQQIDDLFRLATTL